MATLIHTLSSHSKDVNCCAFSASLLSTCSGDKSVRLWNSQTFEELSFSPLLGHSYYVHWCTFSSFGTKLASCSTDGKVIVWDTTSGETLAVFEHENKPIVRVCAFSPDSQFLVSGGADNMLCLWDLSKKTCIRKMAGHDNVIMACAFTPNGAHVISGSTCGDLRIWDALHGQGKCLYYDPDCHDLAISGLAISPTFASANPAMREALGLRTYFMLATCGDNLVRLWDLDTAPVCSTKLRCDLTGHSATVQSVAFSADGHLLASGAVDKLVILWNPISAEMMYTLEGHSRYVTSVSFSPDNLYLASGSHHKVYVWRLGFQQPLLPSSENTPPQGSPAVGDASSPEKETNPTLAHNVISEWTVDAVCEWLSSIGLEEYCGGFRDNQIDGEELQNLTSDTLSRDLGVKALGHRQKILRGVQAVREKGFFSGSQGPVPDDQVPDEYLCPISREIMKDPVIAADGYTYERSAIESWLRGSRNTSPMTNAPLSHTNLTPNRSLKMIIARIYDL
ncbi:WD repeat, SAM and U-box domain-containing protein 1-like [Diadema antillarum]|uniref:WD repeat, SAM and U-box domain-containing protein 1-like n=1 Tax=Diadema antillarum TaxID=105358 RepID=UPI003A8B2C5E